ncbi:coiled-coil domain-containing protein 87 [Engraulis encrasicolus]|uniref:coiled-coil domain-containing protein 87 n=1 Tax=Engraulis encrasicolus TaxID=184585 RepID=UPI002FD58D7B
MVDRKKGNMMTVLRSPAGEVKDHVQDEIIPVSQMESYRDFKQKFRSMSQDYDNTKHSQEKAQEAKEAQLAQEKAVPSSLHHLCYQMQQRVKKCTVPVSPEDHATLESVISSELGLIWADLRSTRPDPCLSRSENQQLRQQSFAEVLNQCEQLYLSYLHLLHSMRRRAVFTDSANRSRLAAQMASDCTNVLNVHSIRQGIAAQIKARRTERARLRSDSTSTSAPTITTTTASASSGASSHRANNEDRRTTEHHPDKITLSLRTGRIRPLSRKQRLAVLRDLAEIKEKCGDFDLETVYELMPYRLDKQQEWRTSKQLSQVLMCVPVIEPVEELPAVQAEDEFHVTDHPWRRLKGCTSMPELSRETLLEEMEMEAPPPRPHSPIVLLATSQTVQQKQRLSLAEDLQRLLEDEPILSNTDTEEQDIAPLIKARFHRSTARLDRLQATLQRLQERRERVTEARVALRSQEESQPQSEVVSVELYSQQELRRSDLPGQTIARMAVSRVTDRLEPEKININMFPPVYNDVNREISAASVEWMDRNLFAGAEVKEVCKELSKALINRYLGFEDDPLIEPYETQAKMKVRKKTPSLINTSLKNSRKRTEAPAEYKKPADVNCRAYSAWFQWWKSYLSLDDYLRFITGQELDYLAVVFQLHDQETKKDTEEEKMRALQQQRDEKKRARTKKMEALKRMKQEYITGVWNVNSVLLGGLWKEPVLEEDNSPEVEEPTIIKQLLMKNTMFLEEAEEAGPMDADQLKGRLERVWSLLCFPDAMRLDMAIKYSSHAYRDLLEKAIVPWEQAAQLIQQREAILCRLEIFERVASDPSRFFSQGYRGTAVARMDESRQREEMNFKMAALENRLAKVINELHDRFKDTVTYKGRPYHEKIRWDRTEMLYWLQQERRVRSLERVVTRTRRCGVNQNVLPARLAPLELTKKQSQAAGQPQCPSLPQEGGVAADNSSELTTMTPLCGHKVNLTQPTLPAMSVSQSQLYPPIHLQDH